MIRVGSGDKYENICPQMKKLVKLKHKVWSLKKKEIDSK